MDSMDSAGSELASSLLALAGTFESVVEKTRADFQTADLDSFLSYSHREDHGIGKLGALCVGYAECLQKVGVKTKVELEQLWTKHENDPEVREAVGKLLAAEKDYSAFLDEIEDKLNLSEAKVAIKDEARPGQMLPRDLTLIDIPSGRPLPLEACWGEADHTLFVLLRLFG